MDTYHDGGSNSELGAQKETFKNRLSKAIDNPLTLENTDTYVDDALGAVINLVEGVVTEYDAQPGAEWQQLGEANGKEHEDAALEYFGLEDVEAILRHLEDKASQFAVIDGVIAQANEASDVFVPPDSTPVLQATGSGTGIEKKGRQPKLENLLFVLMNDFGIDPDDPEAVSIVRGIVNLNMMREEPYYQVTVPGIDKVILVCQEYGNATFVFNGEWVCEQVSANRSSKDESARPLTDYTKEELSKLIKDNPGQGARIMATKNFTANLANALEGGFSQQELDKPVDTRYLRSSRKSEDLPLVPDGYITLGNILERLDIGEKHRTRIRDIAIDLERKGKITIGKYHNKRRRQVLAFTEESAQQIMNEWVNHRILIPEGSLKTQDIANIAGVSRGTVRSVAEELGVIGDKKYGRGRFIIFSKDEASAILDVIRERHSIPDGYVPVTEFVQDRNGRDRVDYGDVTYVVRKLGLKPVKIGGFKSYLPEEDALRVVEEIKKLLEKRRDRTKGQLGGTALK